MRNLLALVGLVVVGFAGLGWYLGWYKLNVSRSSDGNLQIQTNVDTKKVETDASELLKNTTHAIGQQAEKAAQDAKGSTPAGAPGGTPGPVTPAQNSPLNPLTSPGAVTPSTPELPVVPIVPPVQTPKPGTITLPLPK